MLQNNNFKDNHAFRYQLNIWAAFESFYLDIGGYDIGVLTCFLGIPGGRYWERTFHRHSELIHDTVMFVADDIMKKAYDEEIAATIRKELKDDKCREVEINEFVMAFKNKKLMPYQIK